MLKPFINTIFFLIFVTFLKKLFANAHNKNLQIHSHYYMIKIMKVKSDIMSHMTS